MLKQEASPMAEFGRRLAAWIVAIGVAGFAALAIASLPLFGVNHITVEGAIERAERDAAQRIATQVRGKPLWRIDAGKIAEDITVIPGVREVRVRRAFPDHLIITIEKRRPLARWLSGGILGTDGVLYNGEPKTGLPIFKGPDERAVEMAEFYHFANALLQNEGLHIDQIDLDNDIGWRLFINNGWVLTLGRNRVRERMRRFASVQRHAAEKMEKISGIDLRYPNGFAASGELRKSDNTGEVR